MTADRRPEGGEPDEPGLPVAGGPGGTEAPPLPDGFLDELVASFSRQSPEGTLAWNFADAFSRLDRAIGPWSDAGSAPDRPGGPGDPLTPSPPSTGGLDTPPVGVRRRLRRRAESVVLATVGEVVGRLAARALAETIERSVRTEEALAALDVQVGVVGDSTREGLRYLGARLAELENGVDRGRDPLGWMLVEAGPTRPVPSACGPPGGPLPGGPAGSVPGEAWAGPVTAWLAGGSLSGEVLHAECGDGSLAAAMRQEGIAAGGLEPSARHAAKAAAAGVPVRIGPVPEVLSTIPLGSLGGLVLSGVVDRLGPADLVTLITHAGAALAPGASLVVLGADPDARAHGWEAVARDLAPGRPLHSETWKLLLAAAGFEGIGGLAPDPGLSPPQGSAMVAVAGRRGP